MEVITPENLLALCAFLAVSGGTLLIYFVISKGPGRTRSQSRDFAAPERVSYCGSVPVESPVAEPLYCDPPVTGAVGRSSGLSALVPLVVVVILVGCLMQFARMEVRRRFAEVIGKINSNRQLGFDFDTNKTKFPDFKIQPIQVQPLQFDPVQGRAFPTTPFPVDGWRGMGMPSGIGRPGAPAPGSRPFFR